MTLLDLQGHTDASSSVLDRLRILLRQNGNTRDMSMIPLPAIQTVFSIPVLPFGSKRFAKGSLFRPEISCNRQARR